ncbi:MAG TPA: flagellar hook-basal body complex protein FliE [Pseudolabrys sp.]|nr:flagellar hook-basal body complex protein FliE [Pseudolabrys sp.]
MATPLAAASAYANITRLSNPAAALGSPSAVAGNGSDASFADMVKNAIGAVQEAGHKADTQTRAAANGNANMVDVVTAVSETEVAIDAVVAVRDKVIAAYEEIMKMTI